MSNPAPRRRPRSPNPARQQLDELDALLQRMLALPVNPEDELAAASEDEPPPVPETVPPGPMLYQEPPAPEEDEAPAPPPLPPVPIFRIQPAPEPDPEPDPEPEAPAPGPILVVEQKLPSPPPPAVEPAPAVPPGWRPPPRAGWLASLGLGLSPRRSTTPPPAPSPTTSQEAMPLPSWRRSLATVPWWLRPLAWVNRTFDRWALRWGRLGRWLRQPGGRTVLGWTGLALLMAALGLVLLDWIGWP